MTRWTRRFAALAAVVFAGALLPAAPALAAATASPDPAVCAGTFYARDGRELFDLGPPYIPPALRSFPPTCASRIAAEPFDDGVGASFSYNAVWYDIPWSEFVAIVRAMDASGYPGIISSVDLAGGGADPAPGQDWSADRLAGLDPVDQASGSYGGNSPLPDGTFRTETVTVSYTNGSTYQNDVAWTVPTLVIGVISSARYDGTGIDDPSVLSTLPTIAEAVPTPAGWAVLGTGSLMLMLIVGYPSALLNSVVGSRYSRLVDGWAARRKERLARAPKKAEEEAARKPRRAPGWLIWPGFAVAAILGAFVDPDFGWNGMSARVVLSLFLSFLLFNLLIWGVVRRVARRMQPDSGPYLRLRWGSLVLVAVAVLVSRLLELEPGVIFGLVAGVAYAVALTSTRSARIVLVGSGIGLLLAAVAWAAYSLLAPATAGSDNPVAIFAVEFLAGVTIKGVSSLPLSLLPLTGFDGAKLLKWRRLAWAGAYLVGLAAFMLVLVTIPKAWGEVPGDFARWLIIFGAYALIAIVVWVVNAVHLKRRPQGAEAPRDEQPDAITID